MLSLVGNGAILHNLIFGVSLDCGKRWKQSRGYDITIFSGNA